MTEQRNKARKKKREKGKMHNMLQMEQSQGTNLTLILTTTWCTNFTYVKLQVVPRSNPTGTFQVC